MNLNELLAEAATQGNLPELMRLIAAGAGVNSKNRKNPPLFDAAHNGHLACVQYLLENGADVNIKNDIGCTPLIAAAYNNHLKIAEILIDAGADQRIQGNGRTALEWAAYKNHTCMVTLLTSTMSAKRDPNQYIHEIVFYRPLEDRLLQEIFNFKSLERISLLRKNEHIEAMTREPFSAIETLPALREAFEVHVKRGGTTDENTIFPHTLYKARLPVVKP